ncbi:MAG: stage II sporulation protein M [Ferruginibacter sp.]
MREAMFIKKNAEKWKTYQHQETKNPDETAERFITLIDDLSYAKTFYPRSKVTRWINGITASIYQSIYQNKKEKYSRIFQFWKFELPMLFKKHHRVFLFTTILFALFVAIGVLTSLNDTAVLRSIVGNDYVDSTERSIRDGNPFGVYSADQSTFNMFARIAFNNIFVAFRMFIGGLTVGLFTLKDLWTNGVMLGSFQYFFFEHGLGTQSILVIWIHGTIEISSIIIAGTAGFVLANGILFPRTYTRMASFKRGIKDAAKILICLIPFFITAAFLESYITRLMSDSFQKGNSGMPIWLSVLILSGSFLLIIWYFVILPIRLSKRGYFIKDDGIVSRLNETNA